MKKSWLKQVIIGVLIIVLTGIPAFAKETLETDKILRANLKLAEMQYRHIEYKEVENLLKQLDHIVNTEDEEALYKWDEAYYDLYCDINTMIQIAQLNYQLHTDQSYYFNEYLYSIDLLGKMKSAYVEIFEEEEDTLSADMTKFYELSIERSKLVDEYLAKELEITILVNQKQVNIIQIIQDTSLDDNQFERIYDQWYTAYNKATGEIMLKLIQIDNQIAKLQGYNTYIESAYANYSRDYTIAEIKQFTTVVKEIIPKIFIRLYKDSIIANYVLEDYTYKNDKELLQNIRDGFIVHHKDLEEAYDYMLKYELYDIQSRTQKETGGFTTYFEQFAEPYIVLNYTAPYETALTLIHEFGHYFSYYKIGENQGGLDLDETYSQALELIAMSYYSEIFKSDKYSKAAKVYTIENMLLAIMQGCLYDEFLEQIYQNPNITVDEMNALYSKLARAYGLQVDGRSWCQAPHNFQTPFYYISYSVSAVAALEVWTKSLDEEEAGIKTYLALIEAGKENSFLESLEKAGINNPLEKETLKRVVNRIEQYFEIPENIQQLDVAA